MQKDQKDTGFDWNIEGKDHGSSKAMRNMNRVA